MIRIGMVSAVAVASAFLTSGSATGDDEFEDPQRYQYRELTNTEESLKVFETIKSKSLANFQKIHDLYVVFDVTDEGAMTGIHQKTLDALSSAAGKPLDDRNLHKQCFMRVELDLSVEENKLFSRTTTSRCRIKSFPGGTVVAEQISPDELLGSGAEKVDLQIHRSVLLTPDECVRFDFLEEYPAFELQPDAIPSHGRAAFVEPYERGQRLLGGSIIDPRHLYGYYPTMRAWELAESFSRSLSLMESGELTAEQRQTEATLNIFESVGEDRLVYKVTAVARNPQGDKQVGEWYFSEPDACNLVVFEQAIERDTMKRTDLWFCTYTGNSGVIIPSMVNHLTADPDRETKRFSQHRILTLKEVRVNQPGASEDRFTLARLGIEDGERVVDKIKGKVFVLQDGELIAAPTSAIEARSAGRLILIVLFNAGVIVVLAWLWFTRRNRKAQSNS